MVMPWFAWIAIVAVVVFGAAKVISLLTSRTGTTSHSPGELDELTRRLDALERRTSTKQLEEPHIPTRAEENMAAEDRWRLDMLEARLENLENLERDEGEEY